jgi:hypothetical protein
MTTLGPILVLGVLILLFAGRLLGQFLSGRRRKRPVTIEDYTTARTEVHQVFVETATIQRILAVEDLKFISQNSTETVQRFFREERKTLAFLWLRKTQKQLARLMDLHLRLASYTRQPSPRVEIKLAGQYFSFLIVSNFVLLLLWLSGPFETVRIITYILHVAGNLCAVFTPRLEDIDPARLGLSTDPWPVE